MNDIKNTNKQNNMAKRGFASMAYEKIKKIASKGGSVSAAKAGHEGMAKRGSKGGQISAAKAGYVGMAERGRKGGYASAESKYKKAQNKKEVS